MQSLDERLDAAIARRNAVAEKKQRIEGRLESARASLKAVEAECREKGIDPDNLEATINQLEEKYRSSVEALEQQVADADAALAPFLKESST